MFHDVSNLFPPSKAVPIPSNSLSLGGLQRGADQKSEKSKRYCLECSAVQASQNLVMHCNFSLCLYTVKAMNL